MQCQFRHAPDLRTVINAPRILTESRFLSVAQQIWAADMVMMSHLSATHSRPIRPRSALRHKRTFSGIRAHRNHPRTNARRLPSQVPFLRDDATANVGTCR